MLKQTLACVQPRQILHCSQTCTKWAYVRHIQSVNAQTRLSMRVVSPESSLLSHMHKNWRTYGIFFQSILRRDLVCMQSCPSLLCSRTYTKLVYTYDIFYQSMLKQTLACVQPRQSHHCSRTWTKWAYIWHFLSVNTQTRLSMRAVLPEPSLLSHMHNM